MMLRLLLGSAILAAIVTPGVSMRNEDGVTSLLEEASRHRQSVGWEKKKARFCMKDTIHLDCDPRSKMFVISAFYQGKSNPKCEPDTDRLEHKCKKNATDHFIDLCQNCGTCEISPDQHWFCAKTPAAFMRIKWECISLDEDAPMPPDCKKEEPELLPAPEVDEEGDDNFFRPELPDPEEMTSTSSSPASEPELEDTEEEEVIPEIDPNEKKEVEQNAQNDTKKIVPEKEGGQVFYEISFQECWRHTRFASWNPFSFRIGKLTNCPPNEGCFMLQFEDGKERDDKDEPPSNAEIMKANLVKGKDSILVVWNGLGLKRNHHNTWGICLPKTGGMYYALATYQMTKNLYLKMHK